MIETMEKYEIMEKYILTNIIISENKKIKMAEQDVKLNEINADSKENPQNEPRRSSRSSRSKINYHLLVNKPRSKSCSHLKPSASQFQIVKDDTEIDNGNELVQMMKTKLVLASPPKPKLAAIPSVDLEISTSDSPTKSLDSSTFSTPADPTLTSAGHADTSPTLTDELKTFMRDAMRKQRIHFENQLQQQQQTQQKQLQQLKYQLQQNFQQQIVQLNSERSSPQIQEEPIITTKTMKKKEPKLMHKKQQNSKQQIATCSKYANAAAGTASSDSKPVSKALLKPTLFPPPEEKQYSARKPRKIDAMILGSSIVKHVKGRTIKQQSGTYVKVCSYPGADTEKVCDHAEVELKYSAPKTVIIHAGGNDLAYGTTADEAVDNIAYLGLELMDRGVKNIAVSSMTPRYMLKNEINSFNRLLKGMCRTYNFDYIGHQNVSFNKHVCQDGVHLNYDGVEILSANYASYLKHLTLGYEE